MAALVGPAGGPLHPGRRPVDQDRLADLGHLRKALAKLAQGGDEGGQCGSAGGWLGSEGSRRESGRRNGGDGASVAAIGPYAYGLR